MSVGLQLLAAICAEGSITKYTLSSELFKGDTEQEAYTFIFEHVNQHGVMPAGVTLEENGIELPDVEEPASYYYDRVSRRFLKTALKAALLTGSDLLNAGEEVEALQSLVQSASEITQFTNRASVVDFAQSALPLVSAAYTKTHLPQHSLLLGWPTLDDMAGGLHGGDVVTICGRPASGKTYCLLSIAQAMWRTGKVPLFISMEMKILQIVQRLSAMHDSKPITGLLKGELPTKAYKGLLQSLTDIKTQHPLWIVDGVHTSTVPEILACSRQLKPDVIFIDAAYLMRNENAKLNRWERATENMELIKFQLAELLDIPVIVSHQLNREAEKKIKKGKADELGVEDIAYTDAIGQVSSLVLGLLQEEKATDVEILYERRVSILKGRNGEVGRFQINWIFDDPPYMNFSEVTKQTVEQLNYIDL